MNTQQPIYLLAGGRGHSLMTIMVNVRKIIESIGKPNPVIAFVGVASLKDNWLVYAILSLVIKAVCPCRIRRVLIARPDADLDKAREILRNADAVFMSGGDVGVGMQILKEKNMEGFFQDLARNGQLFIGVSAGSIMMAQEWVRWRNPNDDSTVEIFPCLGLVPFICDTHAEGDSWAELKTALQQSRIGSPGYGITSGAYLKAFPDGRLEAERGPVACYVSVNGNVKNQPDLLPRQQST